MRSTTITIKESLRHGNPTHIPKILPWIIEWVMPATRTHLVSPLRVRYRTPYPTNACVACGTESIRRSDIDTARADVERELAHVSVYRFSGYFQFRKLQA